MKLLSMKPGRIKAGMTQHINLKEEVVTSFESVEGLGGYTETLANQCSAFFPKPFCTSL
jgi:hypothetical protein